MLVDFHLSVTNGSYQARTWTARFTDEDANHYAISPPLVCKVWVGVHEDGCLEDSLNWKQFSVYFGI